MLQCETRFVDAKGTHKSVPIFRVSVFKRDLRINVTDTGFMDIKIKHIL